MITFILNTTELRTNTFHPSLIFVDSQTPIANNYQMLCLKLNDVAFFPTSLTEIYIKILFFVQFQRMMKLTCYIWFWINDVSLN